MSFAPSKYQTDIFDWISQGRGDGIVNAVAGAGKTTTLVMGAAQLSSTNSLFCAFNKHIAQALNARLVRTRMQAKTIHSLGLGILTKQLGRTKIENRKYDQLAKSYIDRHRNQIPYEERFQVRKAIKQLADMARLTLTDPNDTKAIRCMCDHYLDVTPDQIALRALPEILDQGERLAEMAKIIDFTDMIYLPTKWKLRLKTFEWVFVDECQDLNAAQLELVLSLRAPGGRFLFVGDPNQAIMGFAGADNRAFYQIASRTKATELPLSISYRCPVAHIERAQKIVPQITAAEGAKPGEIIEAAEKELESIVQEGDLILCRLTAPLVEACINLIKKKIPARVRGREIGKNLISMLEKVTDLPRFSYSQIGAYLDKYKEQQTDLLVSREADESQIQSLNDRIECLHVCVTNYPEAKNIEELSHHIKRLFNDERPSVWLSTV